MGTNLWQTRKAFNLLRLLTGDRNNWNVKFGERNKSKHKFGGTKVCEAEEVREYFINPKIENEFFGYFVMKIKLFVVWISEIFYALLVKICCQKQF